MRAEITSSAKREEELSKSDYISLSWNSAEKVVLPVGAYINHTYKIDKVREVTRRFLLLEEYEPTQTDEMSWKYTPEFQHPKMVLSKVPFYIRTRNSQNEEIKQHIWSFVGTMATIADKLKDFLNHEIAIGNAGWTVHYDETNSNTINVSFNDNDFISALSAIANAIGDNCEWHIDYDNEVIHLGKVSDDNGNVVLKVGENVGVPSISNSKESYYNSFAVFGGSRNITQLNNKGENISSSDIRLQLDKGGGSMLIDGKDIAYTIDEYSTIDLRQDRAKEPQFTKVLDFSDIFPSLNTYVYNVRGREKYVLDNDTKEKIPLTYNTDGSVATYKTFTVWYMRLAYPTTEKVADKELINTTIDDGVTHYWYDFEITDNLLINGKNIGCSFEANFNKDALSTPLAGRGSNGNYVGFELTYHKEASSSHSSDDVSGNDFSVLAGDYEIVYQEDNGLIIPTNAVEMIVPKGEALPSLKCNITVLYNIVMADSIYIKDAQQRLFDAAIKEIQRLRSDLNNYTIKSYPQVFVEQNPCLQIGQKVTYDDGNGYTLSTRVLKLSTNIDYNFIQEITVGNQAIKGTITQLKDDVQSIIASGGGNGSGCGGYTESQLKNLIARYGTGYFLSKQFNDTAQGLITFAKGLISEMLAQLKAGATFGNSGYKFDKDGNVVVDAISSLAFDEALERGFGITKNARGKYTLSVTDLMVWGKAVFNSLEIRKLYSVGGNVYLSGASSKLQHVVPVTDAEGEVTGWKCYILGDDGTTATQNGWARYDQAKCQTFDIKEGVYENVSNTYYWRLVTDVSTENEAITETRTEKYVDEDGQLREREVTVDLYDGKKFGWVILSKTDCESAANDAPKAGDTIVLDGHRMFASGDAEGRDQYNDESRTNVMMLETTGVSDGSLPRIVALTGITDYRHSDGKNKYSNTVFILSPKEVVFVSSSIKWISASGDPITFVNFRGNWATGTEYAYYDQVSHNDSIWTCIVEKGKATTAEPSDTSKDWRKEISGGKGDPAVTYELVASPSYIKLDADGSFDRSNQYREGQMLLVRGYKIVGGKRITQWGDADNPISIQISFNDGAAWYESTFNNGESGLDEVYNDFEPTCEDSYFSMLQEMKKNGLKNCKAVMYEGESLDPDKIPSDKVLARIDIPIVQDGKDGASGTSYGVTLTVEKRTISSVEDDCLVVTFTKGDTDGVTMTNNVQDIGGYAQLYVDGKIDTSATARLNLGTSEAGELQKGTFPQVFTAGYVTVKWYDKEGGTLLGMGSLTRGADGKQGDGVVMAYKHADTQPGAPTGTDPENPGDGWSLSPDAATAGEKVTDVRYGGYESGTYDGNNKGTDATAKEWAEAEDDGRTWMKSPSGLGDNFGYALMKVSFTTQYDNTTVDVEIKAYSEQNYDLVEVWALDTAPDTGTTFRGQGLAHASGNGVEQAYSFTVAKAGRHFICVTYAKDISGNDNGDYGLFRLDLSDNEVAVSDTVWMSQAKVSGGKCVLPWSTPVKINGADGKGALEISVDPDTLVFDTDDDGIVPSATSKRATIACYRDGKKVTNVDYSLMEGGHPDCDASISTSNSSTATVTISNIAKDETYGVSKTSGTVEVQVYDKDNGRNYFPRVKFSVNVAKFNGGLKADNKKLQSQYSQLTNNGSVTDLVQYKSEILQTAKEISLKVSEKSVGRRNMLVGSACRKFGDGFKYMSGSETLYYDGYPLEQIEINSGIDGVNCIHCRTKRTGTDIYLLSGFSWNGISPQGNIKLEKGKNYVLSFYAKTPTPNEIFFIAEVLYQGSKIDTSRPAKYDGPTGYSSTFSASEANKWELFTVKLSVPSNAKYEYEEINIFARGVQSDYFVDGYICKPMLEEGEEYNGWTLSEQDYDYVGGNLLDGTGTLTKTGNVEVLDETTVKQDGYNNESASVKAILLPTMEIGDFLQYSTKDMGLKVGEDCMLSFYARAASGYAPGGLQCYLYSPSTGIVLTESSHEKLDFLWNPGDGDLHTHITPTTAWKRYWVHWRPMGNVPQYILFRLVRPGTNKESYDSSTSYNVGDVVLYGGTYYVCQKAGIGYAPGASSHWEATEFAIEIARPKLEVGATMTEWTAKRADMVDKQALYATGIDIDSKKITLTADHTYVRTNDGTPMVLIDADGNLTNVKVNADMVNVSATHKLSISGNGSMVVDMDNFKLDESGNASFKGSIDSKSGTISFFTFTESGMYSATSSSMWGLGLRATNISVRGTPGGRTSLVCLGNGQLDTTGGNDSTFPKSVVNGQNVNYCNLIQVTGGGPGNGRDAAALGIETQGDYCLSAMGGLSHLQGLALDASTTSGSTNRTLFLCSSSSFTMPSNPKAGQLVIVIQTTGTGITFYGGGKSFRKGASTSSTAKSGSAGQWNFFVYDDSVSCWRCVYANGGLF